MLRGYLCSMREWRLWALFLTVLAAYAANIRLALLYNDWNGRFFNALQAADRAGILRGLFYFMGLAAAIILLLVWADYLKGRLKLALRRGLTELFFKRWLSEGSAHCLLKGSGAEPDNPDQRITEDVALLASLSMELLHPAKKPLECVACMLNAPEQILLPAVRRTGAEYVLLEENGTPDFNPVSARKRLEALGIRTRVLDVRGAPEAALRRAAALYSEERQAERAIRARRERLNALKALPVRRGQRAAVLLGIRNPARHKSYVFRVAAHAAHSKLLQEAFGLSNVFESPASKDEIEGIQPLGDLGELFERDPNLIALTGDAAACSREVFKAIRERPALQDLKAVREGRIVALPYYCRPLAWRSPEILEAWADALCD